MPSHACAGVHALDSVMSFFVNSQMLSPECMTRGTTHLGGPKCPKHIVCAFCMTCYLQYVLLIWSCDTLVRPLEEGFRFPPGVCQGWWLSALCTHSRDVGGEPQPPLPRPLSECLCVCVCVSKKLAMSVRCQLVLANGVEVAKVLANGEG